MKKRAKMIILTIIIILWMAFIFSMSAKNSTQSANISGGFIYNILNTFFAKFRGIDKTTQDSIVEGLQFIVRKGAHFSAYAILGGLCFIDLTVLDKFKSKNNFIIAFIIVALYATSDEIHQYFVPGRSCELRDVMIDSCGALTGIIIVIVFSKLIKKLKQRHISQK
ncbi:VanZ family protein [Intestinibacter bartlettii]|uniref:VanZ family protein n=1 Tax=Intestinibacter bartlettii TaxID=261299 RepID=A0ABS6DZN1_9FIRM|nr:VanZ family protein [Intestinibacter bartlettii]MBU5337205.1 VanZ family protein [Intestinibacter bartlettii]